MENLVYPPPLYEHHGGQQKFSKNLAPFLKSEIRHCPPSFIWGGESKNRGHHDSSLQLTQVQNAHKTQKRCCSLCCYQTAKARNLCVYTLNPENTIGVYLTLSFFLFFPKPLRIFRKKIGKPRGFNMLCNSLMVGSMLGVDLPKFSGKYKNPYLRYLKISLKTYQSDLFE